jgi:quercetin dioxygenase-like cupin family protein
MRHPLGILCAAAIGLAAGAAAAGAQLVPSAPVQVTPDHLVWTPYPAGGVQAFLLGDPSQPGTYVVRIRLPAGLRLAPHAHPDGRIVQVLSGTMYFALGDSGDSTRLKAFPPGSMWTEPPGAPHYAWARDSEVVLQIVGTGPSGSRPVSTGRQ